MTAARSRVHVLAMASIAALASLSPTSVGAEGAPPAWLEVPDPSDRYALPDAPAPPTLPDLTHRAMAVSVETTLAQLSMLPPSGTSGPKTNASGFIQRLEIEQSLSIRRWYLGVSEALAASTAPSGGGFLWVASQPEIWGRAVWASRAGLAYGGGIGLVPRVFSHGESGRAATESVRAVRPWDSAQFLNNTWTLRPFIDVRQIEGPIILQLRQGFDWAVATGAEGSSKSILSTAIQGSTELISRTTFFVGYRPSELLDLGVEFWEVYAIKTRDAAYAVSPSIRIMTPVFQPALSLLVPIDRPLVGSLDTYWAVRLNMGVVIDPERFVQQKKETKEPKDRSM